MEGIQMLTTFFLSQHPLQQRPLNFYDRDMHATVRPALARCKELKRVCQEQLDAYACVEKAYKHEQQLRDPGLKGKIARAWDTICNHDYEGTWLGRVGVGHVLNEDSRRSIWIVLMDIPKKIWQGIKGAHKTYGMYWIPFRMARMEWNKGDMCGGCCFVAFKFPGP